jgi:hypothetical protein
MRFIKLFVLVVLAVGLMSVSVASAAPVKRSVSIAKAKKVIRHADSKIEETITNCVRTKTETTCNVSSELEEESMNEEGQSETKTVTLEWVDHVYIKHHKLILTETGGSFGL